ncbi:hypothetical protein [Vibrio harveyi]|uniref:hypothetical protein n=1 Tax=Vibrio harveyi TaxID=669 RepID=UPI003CED0DC8
MKRLLILSSLLFASQTFAGWNMNQNGVATEISSNDFASMAVLEYSPLEDDYYVSFLNLSQLNSGNCKPDETIREINGQLVKLFSMCDRGSSRYYGSTEDGRDFILNQFKTKNSVKVGDNVYSAMGFSAALKKIKQRKEMEKKAL